jgi:hypothetical protein
LIPESFRLQAAASSAESISRKLMVETDED